MPWPCWSPGARARRSRVARARSARLAAEHARFQWRNLWNTVLMRRWRACAPRPEVRVQSWRAAIHLVIAAIAVLWTQAGSAQTKVRVGQPQAGTFQFVPLQVGTEAGIFRKHGIDLEVISFGGGPRVQQAIAADSIDIGIGSGPELAFVANGAPEIGLAAIADAPYS